MEARSGAHTVGHESSLNFTVSFAEKSEHFAMSVPPPTSVGSHDCASSPPPLPPPQQGQDDKQLQQLQLLQQRTNGSLGQSLAYAPSQLALGIASVVIGSVNLDNSCDYNIAALLIVTGSLSLASALLGCAQCLGTLGSPGEKRPKVTTFFTCVSCPLFIATFVIMILQIINLVSAWDTRTQCGVGMYWYAMTLYVILPAVFIPLACCLVCCCMAAGVSLLALLRTEDAAQSTGTEQESDRNATPE